MAKRHNVLLISVIFWLTFVEGSRYRFDYTYNQEADGWLKYHVVPATFISAFKRCHAEGAVLASPLNTKLRLAMQTLSTVNGNTCGIFTGIHAIFSKEDFSSVEGVPLSKIPVTWAPNEPDNYKNNEDCTIMLQNGTLADVQCNDSFPYICFRRKSEDLEFTVCGTDKEYKLDERTGSCYKFHRVGLTWRRAYMTCIAEGGQLAIINSPTEAQVIKDIFAKNPANTIVSPFRDVASIGFYDMGERTWYTIHGQSLEEAGFSTFSGGQPDNNKSYDNGSFCGGVFRNGLLDDLWCSGATIPFICEKKFDSLVADDDKNGLKR